MDPEGSLQCSQQPTIGPYLDEFSTHPAILSFQIHFNIIF
jgi:hypothetical protein